MSNRLALTLLGYCIYIVSFAFGFFHYPDVIVSSFLKALIQTNQPQTITNFIVMNVIALGPPILILYSAFPIFIYPGTFADRYLQKD